jgi:hypothetical protein
MPRVCPQIHVYMNAGAYTHFSVYMGAPRPISGSNRSRPVRECIPRHSVSWCMTRVQGLADTLFFPSIHSLTNSRPQGGLVIAFLPLLSL